MMRKQTRFRCTAQRGWHFVTREGRVGFFDTRREAEVMYQRYAREKGMTHKRKREKGGEEFRPIA